MVVRPQHSRKAWHLQSPNKLGSNCVNKYYRHCEIYNDPENKMAREGTVNGMDVQRR